MFISGWQQWSSDSSCQCPLGSPWSDEVPQTDRNPRAVSSLIPLVAGARAEGWVTCCLADAWQMRPLGVGLSDDLRQSVDMARTWSDVQPTSPAAGLRHVSRLASSCALCSASACCGLCSVTLAARLPACRRGGEEAAEAPRP